MKIRTDFVTNSSSSSFVVGFTSESKIADELRDCPGGYYNMLLRDVNNAQRITVEELREMAVHELRCDIEWDLEEEYGRTHGWGKAWEYVISEDGQNIVDERVALAAEDVCNKAANKPVLAIVEYEDDEYPEMEHDIMPILDATIVRFSHH